MRRLLVALLLAACSDGALDAGFDAPRDVDGPANRPDGAVQAKGGLHVQSGHIVDGAGHRVRLHGANRAGSEYACLYGNVFDGPSDQASLDAMKSWGINAVRVPMNEDCWLGLNGAAAASSGANYRNAIRAYVTLLEQNGFKVILDLHWAAPGGVLANGQLGMADADHAPAFWTQVATAYSADDAHVIFDLFNEPFITDWDCWLHGGNCADDYAGHAYTVAGMAQLYQAVRDTGAQNLVMLGGLAYSSDFSQWVAKVQSISTINVVASWHTYSDQSVQTLCPTQYNGYSHDLHCADGATTAANYGITSVLAAGFPVVTGEIGIGAYAIDIAPYTMQQGGELTTWLDSTLSWIDDQEQSYLAWDWNTEAPPLLITSFDGTPSPYFGATYKAHLQALDF